MKLSINKLLIGFLFVFSVILIPTGVARANTYTVGWDYIPGWGTCQTTVDLNLTADSPHKYIVAAGGVSNDNGCSGGTIRIIGQLMPAGGSKLIFSGPTSSSGGGAVFDSLADGMHYIAFTGSVSKTGMSNYSFEIGNLGAEIVSTDPVVTVYATGKTPSTTPSNPLSISYNTGVDISWTSTNNATSCTCTYGNGINCAPSGVSAGTDIKAIGNPYTLTESKTFNVTCSN